jgi:hypothetical protein
MKLLAISRRAQGATGEDIARLQRPEVAAVWAMIGAGFIREIYFDPARPAVVLILEAASVAVAEAQLATLPMAKAGVIGFDLLTLGPYRQIETLFAAGDP